MRRITPFFPLFVLLVSHFSLAISYPLPPEGSRLVGHPVTIAVPQNNTQPLEAFAARYGQGLSNMLEANPGVDVFLPQSGSTLVVPQQLILPDTVREGIVVNVAEMRLSLSQTKKFHCPLRQCCARLSKGMTLILHGLMRCWSAVQECRLTSALAGQAFKYPATLLIFMGWSICIACYSRIRRFIPPSGKMMLGLTAIY